MKNDDYYYDYLTNSAYEWMPCNVYHDEYRKKKKQQESEKAKKAAGTKEVSSGKKQKKPSRLGLFFHRMIFDGIFHARYSDYVDWFVSHNDGNNPYDSRASMVRFLSVVFVPVGYFITCGLISVCKELYTQFENGIFPMLSLAILAAYIAAIIGLWKAATIEFSIIASAKERARALRFEKMKQQYKNHS